jgi:spore germination protein KC
LGFVMALGIDLGPDRNSVTVTTMIAVPAKIAGGGSSGGGGGGSEEGSLVISMNAPTIYEAFNRINTVLNREITLNQNLTLLIGEDLAKQEVNKWADTLVRYREMRRTMLIFICRGKAAEIMNFKPEIEKNPSEYFADLAKLSVRNGMFPVTMLHDFMLRYEGFYQENYAPIIAKYQLPTPGSKEDKKSQKDSQTKETGKSNESSGSKEGSSSKGGAGSEAKNIRLVGTAIFKQDRLVGSFDNYESQALLLLTGEFREAMLTISDPREKGNYISFRLLQSMPPAIRYRRREGEDDFFLKLKLEADLVSIQSGINYTTPRMEGELARHIARTIQNRLIKVITKAQQEYQSDVFGFGKKVQQSFIITQEWENYHWPERFPQAKITTAVKVNIRRVGVQLAPPVPR